MSKIRARKSEVVGVWTRSHALSPMHTANTQLLPQDPRSEPVIRADRGECAWYRENTEEGAFGVSLEG